MLLTATFTTALSIPKALEKWYQKADVDFFELNEAFFSWISKWKQL